MAQLSSTCWVIFGSLIIDLLAFTVILPLMPSIFDYYANNDHSGVYVWLESKVQLIQSLIGSPIEYNRVLFGGIIGSWFSLLQFLVMPITGSLSDFYGRKPVMLLSLVGISLSYSIWLFSKNSFLWFIMSRTVGGLSKGNVSLGTAVVTDSSSQSQRGKAMALIGIAFSIGFIIGPMLGGLFAHWTKSSGTTSANDFLSTPPIYALTLSIINIFFVFFLFEESLLPKQRSTSLRLDKAYQYINPFSLFKFSSVQDIQQKDLKLLKRLSLVYFFFLYFYSGLEFTLTFLTHTRFNYTSMQQGKLYLFAGIIMALVQGGYMRRIKPGNEFKTALMGILIVIPSFVIIGLATNTIYLYFGMILYSISSATAIPCLTSIVSSTGPIHQKGVILGSFRSIGSLSRALGPITFSLIFWRFGPLFCYCFGGVMLLLPLVLMLNVKSYSKTSSKQK